ncbi:MAG: T9SS type A sorting domain-containing protein [Dinghuibacter sp.]|nr:T9SS type A sorting domain-containing protein [Dinghuibacter sp.]
MKRVYIILFAAFWASIGRAQFLDDFNYTTGANLTANGWTQIGAGTTGPLTINNAGLSYPSSPSSGIGFGVNMAPGQQVVGRGGGILSVSPATAGATAYMSFFVTLSAAGNTAGVNFAGIMTGSFPTPGVGVRAFTRQSGAGFNFGLGKTNLTATYESTVRTLNTTYLVVLKYTVNTGTTTDDIVDIWINPVLGATEPASTLSMGSGIADATLPLFGPTFNPRTAPAAPTLEFDAVRVGTTWASVTPSNVALTVSAASLNFGTTPVGTPGSSQTFNVAGTNLSPAPGLVTVTAPSAEFQVSNDNSTWGSSTTIAYTTATLASTPVYVRFSPTATGPFTGNITLSGGGVIITPTVAVSGAGGTAFYSKPTGSLSALATWGNTANGTGTSPADFVSDYQIFIVCNRASYTLDADWQIFGTGSKIVVGNGTDATTLILPASFTILNTVDNKVDVGNNSTVEVANKLYRGGSADPAKVPFPYFGTTALSSTVEYSWNGTTTADTVRIPTEIFGNLKLTNGLKYFSPGFVFANGNLLITDVTGMNGTGTNSSVLVRGNVTLVNSFFDTDPSSDATRMSLNLGGSGTQTISGGDFYVNQLRTQAVSSSVPASTIDIVLAPNTNLITGFISGASSGGGINLQQATHNISLNGNSLTMNHGSSFLATSQGTISGTAASNIFINKTTGSGAIGSISFKAGGQVLNNFSLNATGTGSNNLGLNSPLTINGTLGFNNGNIVLGAHTLTVAGTISGASATGYAVTNGAGALKINAVGATNVLFPVGPSTTAYHPATLNNSGTTDNFSVNVVAAAPPCVDAASSVTATWNITEEITGGSNCTISLNYTGAATGGTYAAAAAKVADCGGAPPYYSNGSVTGTVATGTGFTSFSPFGITNNITILPVALIHFAGSRAGGRNNLTWTTTTEQNNRGFEVQRSADGQNYTVIAFVNTLAPGGSNQPLTYHFSDENFPGVVQYYRLRQVDRNDNSRFSAVVKIRGENPIELSINGISPNPVKNTFTVSISSPNKKMVTLQVVDVSGSIVLQQRINIIEGENAIPVNISALGGGVYVLKAIHEHNHQTPAIKFIKQ